MSMQAASQTNPPADNRDCGSIIRRYLPTKWVYLLGMIISASLFLLWSTSNNRTIVADMRTRQYVSDHMTKQASIPNKSNRQNMSYFNSLTDQKFDRSKVSSSYTLDLTKDGPLVIPHVPQVQGLYPFTQGLERIEISKELEECYDQSTDQDEISYFLESTGTPAYVRIIKMTFHEGWNETRLTSANSLFNEKSWNELRTESVSIDVIHELEINDIFGEGVAQLPGSSMVLFCSWQDSKIFLLEATCEGNTPSFRVVSEHRYPLTGWGLSHNGSTELYATDGSSNLYVWPLDAIIDASNNTNSTGSKSQLSRVLNTYETREITCNGLSIAAVNELHYHSVRDSLIGMIFDGRSHRMIEFDPYTGECITTYNLSRLGPAQPHSASQWHRANAVINGISIIKEGLLPEDDEMLVTGKLWDSLFLVQFKPA